MSRLTTLRHVVDFAEDGVTLAEDGPGELARGLDELIVRLNQEGLLDELTAHRWIRIPTTAWGEGSRPKRGCLSALARWWGRGR